MLLLSVGQLMADGMDGASAAILKQYLAASAAQVDTPWQGSMELEISAFVPKLKKQGRLHALRNISKVGQVTYRVLGFQGDNAIKNQVIARYLQAEQQGHGDPGLALVPANYKFKFKGERGTNTGSEVYIFQVSPRQKRTGLFKGEVWLDAQTHLPVYEKGRLVKNPSIFFKKVDFERAYTIRNGAPFPEHLRSTIETRVVGRVELNVNYSSAGSAGSEEAETNSQSLPVN
ncbi:MAG TPA: hypothetical protein VH325_07510 [Bryobacteraceae bacterium]|jgi:hypothetical protein|nr:hypothetical protein [Bryobacteraceae bacterium]